MYAENWPYCHIAQSISAQNIKTNVRELCQLPTYLNRNKTTTVSQKSCEKSINLCNSARIAVQTFKGSDNNLEESIINSVKPSVLRVLRKNLPNQPIFGLSLFKKSSPKSPHKFSICEILQQTFCEPFLCDSWKRKLNPESNFHCSPVLREIHNFHRSDHFVGPKTAPETVSKQ